MKDVKNDIKNSSGYIIAIVVSVVIRLFLLSHPGVRSIYRCERQG